MFEPVTKSFEDITEELTKTMTECCKENYKGLANLNDQTSLKFNDRGIIVFYMLCPLSKITNLEQNSQMKLLKGPDSIRVTELFISKTIPVNLDDILLTFRDTDRRFALEGGLLKMLNNKNYNAKLSHNLAKFPHKKLVFEFAEEKFWWKTFG